MCRILAGNRETNMAPFYEHNNISKRKSTVVNKLRVAEETGKPQKG